MRDGMETELNPADPSGRERSTRDAEVPRKPRGGIAEAVRLAAKLRAVLGTSGLHHALAHLNQRTRFRYTGLYRTEPPVLRNLQLFDRENPTLLVDGGQLVLRDSYCGIVFRCNTPFSTADSMADARLSSHPAREWMVSYAGVPIRTRGGEVWGTLCHWDVRPRLVPPTELSMLESVVPLFIPWLEDNEGLPRA